MPEQLPIRVLVADDHQLMLNHICEILHSDDRFTVAGTAKNGAELITNYFKLLPDIILTDISMPELSGIDAVKEIKTKDKDAKVLFLSMYDNEGMFLVCVNAGGLGLISKDIFKDDLLNALCYVNTGRHYFRKYLDDDELQKLLLLNTNEKNEEQPNLSLLNCTELKYFELFGMGLTTKEIAESLNVTKHTCEFHREAIMLKLDIKSVPMLIRKSVQYLHAKGMK